MTASPERLREWIISKLNQRDVYGLEWHQKPNMTFKVIWLHQRNGEWKDEYGQVFLEWAQHTGKYRPGQDKNYTQWKTTLRNALHKCDEFKEIRKSPPREKPYPYKIYQILERKRKRPAVASATVSVFEEFPAVPSTSSEDSRPIVVDEMCSPDSSMTSPAQQVPDDYYLPPEIVTDNATGQCERGGTSRSSSTGTNDLNDLKPSQELHFSSSEFRKLLADVDNVPQTEEILPPNVTPSSCNDPVRTDDILHQAISAIDPPLQPNEDQNLLNDLAEDSHGIGDVLPISQDMMEWLNNESSSMSLGSITDLFSNSTAPFDDRDPAFQPHQRSTPGQLIDTLQGNDQLCNQFPSEAGTNFTGITEDVTATVGNPVTEAITKTFLDTTRDGANVFIQPSLGDGTVQLSTTDEGQCTRLMTSHRLITHQDGDSFTKYRSTDTNAECKVLEKYKYEEMPPHSCNPNIACHLFLELLYNGHIVKEWSVLNPNGCRVHSKINDGRVLVGRANHVNIDAIYGPDNKDSCELPSWPEEIKVKSPEKVRTIMSGLSRGILLDSHEGSLHVTRLCKVEVYGNMTLSSETPFEISRTKKDDVHQTVRVFDYDEYFIPALTHFKAGGPKPSTGVYIQFAQTTADKSKVFVMLRVTSCQALRDLHEAVEEKEDQSISLHIAPADAEDELDSLMRKVVLA